MYIYNAIQLPVLATHFLFLCNLTYLDDERYIVIFPRFLLNSVQPYIGNIVIICL